MDFDTSDFPFFVARCQIGVGGDFFKEIFDYEIAHLGVLQKKTTEILWQGLEKSVWYTYLC